MAVVGSLLLAGVAAVLLAAAIAKTVAARRDRLSWPDPTLAGVPIPAGAVITAEAAVALTVPVLPAPRYAALALAAVYGALSIAAWRLRGRTCACFGARSSVVGPGHVAGTIAGGAACIMLAIVFSGGWGLPWWVRTAALAVGAAMVLTLAQVRIARAAAATQNAMAATWDPARLTGADAIVVVTQAHCPHCATLRVLLEGMINDRLLHWIDLGDSRDARAAIYRDLAANRTPCAIVIDVAGRPLAEPRWGTGDIPRLAETFLRARLAQQVSGPQSRSPA